MPKNSPKNVQEQNFAEPAAAEAAKRNKVTKKDYLRGNEVVKDPREADGLRLEILGAGTIEVHQGDFSPEIENGLTWFGANILLTNTLGGKQGSEAYEAAMARFETLAAGEWSDRSGATGPRISQLAEAMVSAWAKAGKMAADGTPVTIEKASDYLKNTGEEGRAKIAAIPGVQAELKRIQREAAEKREAEAAAKAVGQGIDIDI